jgi:hypothetical protein
MRFGLVAAPLVMDVPMIKYQGQGISHQRRAEIPLALHANRVERMNLRGGLRHADRALTSVLATSARSRAWIGRHRSRSGQAI